jgi:hypothetical protein
MKCGGVTTSNEPNPGEVQCDARFFGILLMFPCTTFFLSEAKLLVASYLNVIQQPLNNLKA